MLRMYVDMPSSSALEAIGVWENEHDEPTN